MDKKKIDKKKYNWKKDDIVIINIPKEKSELERVEVREDKK
jgi:hypothetical protein